MTTPSMSQLRLREINHWQLFSRIAGLLTILVGTVTILGWIFEIRALKGYFQGISMKGNTAIAFILIGTSLNLLFVHRISPKIQRLGVGCATLPAIIGLLTICEHWFDIDIGIDQILFRELPGEAATTSPGRMGPNASTSFFLSGLGLLLLHVYRKHTISQVLASLVCLLSLLPLVGYIYQANQLYGVARFTGISIYTAATFFIFSLGLLTSSPHHGIIAELTSDLPGGRLARRMLLAILFVPLIFGGLRLIGQRFQLFDVSFGMAVFVVCMIFIYTLILWINAGIINKVEWRRREAEATAFQAESSLRDSEARLQLALLAARLGSWNWTPADDSLKCTPEWFEIHGIPTPVPRLLREEWMTVIHPDDRETISYALERSILARSPISIEYRVINPKGEIRWLMMRGATLSTLNPPTGDLGGITIDITDRKESEELRALLASIVITSQDAIISKDLNGVITSWNRGAEAIFGYTETEIIGQSITKIIPDHLLDEEAEIIRKLRHGEKLEHYVTQRLTRNGQLLHVSLSISPLRNANGTVIGASTIVRDVTEQIEARQQINAQVALLNLTPDAIISRDLEGGITFWNTGAQNLYKWNSDEAIGKKFHILLQTEFDENYHSIEVELFKNGKWSGELTQITREGKKVIVESRWILQLDNSGEPIAILESNLDITARRQIEIEREQLLTREQLAREQAEQANRLKDEFLATVSHELRTPLNHIFGWVILLRDGKLAPEETRRAIEIIERNARAQNHLIEDLLDVSRIITGRLRLDVQAVQIAPIIEAAVEAARPAASAKNIRLQIRLDPRSIQAIGDPQRLQQVVWNLLSNAIKFTPAGGRVEVNLVRQDTHFEIIVSDSGIGIAPEFLPRVFERFTQQDSSTTRHQGGLGLGLSIVRYLIELHGGTVSAYSQGANQGSTFTVSLPIKSEINESSEHFLQRFFATPSLPAELPELQDLKVMLVDDEEESLDILKAILEPAGAVLKTATGMIPALTLFDAWTPDILVSDIGMPNGDGYELIRQIRERERCDENHNKLIPAVALTAYASTQDRMNALSAGFQMHVIKPVEPAEILTIIASLTGRLNKG